MGTIELLEGWKCRIWVDRVALTSTRGGYHRIAGKIVALTSTRGGYHRIAGKIVVGYDTCHCLELIYCLQHSCILYYCLLGGMCVHFKFPGLARVHNIYCIFVYSVIDPSGT